MTLTNRDIVELQPRDAAEVDVERFDRDFSLERVGSVAFEWTAQKSPRKQPDRKYQHRDNADCENGIPSRG